MEAKEVPYSSVLNLFCIVKILKLFYPIITRLSCHYFSFLGRFVFAMQKQWLCFASDPLVSIFIALTRVSLFSSFALLFAMS